MNRFLKESGLMALIVSQLLFVISCSGDSPASGNIVSASPEAVAEKRGVDNFDFYVYGAIRDDVPYLSTITYGWAFYKDPAKSDRAIFFLSSISNYGLSPTGVPLGENYPVKIDGNTIYEEYSLSNDIKDKTNTLTLIDGSCGQIPVMIPALFKVGVPIKFERTKEKMVFSNPQGEDVTALKNESFKNTIETLHNPRCPSEY